MSVRNNYDIRGLGQNQNNVHIAATSGGILFDITAAGTALNNGRVFSAADITVEQAQAIVDALTASIAEVKANLPPPDIELPGGLFGTGKGILSATVTLDGQKLHLVNWGDYRGCEVRRAASFAPTLGWLTRFLRNKTRNNNTFNVETADGSVKWTELPRVDEALRALLANS